MATNTTTPSPGSPQGYVYPDGRRDPASAGPYIGYSVKTLAIWRSRGTGPKFIKVGGRVFYRTADLDEWLASFPTVSSTAQARALKAAA